MTEIKNAQEVNIKARRAAKALAEQQPEYIELLKRVAKSITEAAEEGRFSCVIDNVPARAAQNIGFFELNPNGYTWSHRSPNSVNSNTLLISWERETGR